VALTLALLLLLPAGAADQDKATGGHLLSHDVFFTLKDHSAEAKQKLVDSCKKYLADHPGVVVFTAGTLAEDLNQPVNDRDFDVVVHILFKDKAAHDEYQVSDTHKEFIKENRESWSKVRVFDSYVERAPHKK
jgi:hypothetical protein